MYTGCETDRRGLRAATLEYRRVLFHRLCNGTRRPLELAAALLACGFLLAFVFLRWLRTFFNTSFQYICDRERQRAGSYAALQPCTLQPLHCLCTRF